MEYGNSLLEGPGNLQTLKVSELKGGYAAASVYRIDLEFRSADGGLETISMVQKYTHEGEVRVMQALNGLPSAAALPLTIDCARGPSATDEEPHNWFVTPLYDGDHLTFEDEVPVPVIESLARVHAYFAPRVEQFDWLHHVDAGAFYGVFDDALKSVDAAQRRQPNALLEQAHSELRAVREDAVIVAVLERLPVTLTHGDVHPWNVIRFPDGRSVLIDWGNAKIAPAMLDLANLVEIDSPNWAAYLATWEAGSGEAMDIDLARLGYYWATVMINLQYLPFGAGQWPGSEEAPAGALDMVGRLRQAIENMRKSSLLQGLFR